MWYWWVAAIAVWLLSAACIISTIGEVKKNKTGPNGPKPGNFWGSIVFHGVTAIIALLLLGKAIF